MNAPPESPSNDTPPTGQPARGEVYVEFHQVGSVMKVSAVDATTGIEVSIMGPANTARVILEKNVLRKLEYVMKRQNQS